MSIIQFNKTNCKNCYKCIRACEVKSITFSNEQASILEDECIYCGRCYSVCPHHAKTVRSDLAEVKSMLKRGERVYASVAPSYVSAFPDIPFGKLSAALKQLGFAGAEETAVGAARVTEEYRRLLAQGEMKNIITTCCPTVVLLVEKYFPDLVQYLAPVMSPFAAHGALLKEVHGDYCKVVFIGPCISKMYEAEHSTGVDNVLFFEEVRAWLDEMGVNLDSIEADAEDFKATVNRLYPVPGGILKSVGSKCFANYKKHAVDGLVGCKEALEALRDSRVSGFVVEMSACENSCVKGPDLRHHNTPFLLTRENIAATIDKTGDGTLTEKAPLDIAREYQPDSKLVKDPDERIISAILATIGKTTPESMINCGSCGYPTCRDKAIAVFRGKADAKMCMPYMREKAESMSNIIMENTPNAIFLINKELEIMEYNPAASEMFGMQNMSYTGLPVEMVLSCEDFAQVLKTHENIGDHHVNYDDRGLTVEQDVIYLEENDALLVLIRDITDVVRQSAQMAALRKETAETAQRVIEKQMRVAQEIASLLGESTGETKAVLTKLKKSIVAQSSEEI